MWLPLHHTYCIFPIFSHKVLGMTELPFTHIIPGMDSSELVWVEAGTFKMGSNERDREKPIHEVTIPSFAIGKYPVTQELWTALMGNNPSRFVGLQRPVDQISWYDTQDFFEKINRDPRLQPGQKFRLPSEAEWEYAARGGSKSENFRYAGGDKLDEVGWYDDNSHGETKEVGLKLPNELGLYDLSGNVWEWCEDQYHDTYKDAPRDGSAWLGLKKDVFRVLRGSSWYDFPEHCRPSYRGYFHPAHHSYGVGFRVVLFFPPGS